MVGKVSPGDALARTRGASAAFPSSVSPSVAFDAGRLCSGACRVHAPRLARETLSSPFALGISYGISIDVPGRRESCVRRVDVAVTVCVDHEGDARILACTICRTCAPTRTVTSSCPGQASGVVCLLVGVQEPIAGVSAVVGAGRGRGRGIANAERNVRDRPSKCANPVVGRVRPVVIGAVPVMSTDLRWFAAGHCHFAGTQVLSPCGNEAFDTSTAQKVEAEPGQLERSGQTDRALTAMANDRP